MSPASDCPTHYHVIDINAYRAVAQVLAIAKLLPNLNHCHVTFVILMVKAGGPSNQVIFIAKKCNAPSEWLPSDGVSDFGTFSPRELSNAINNKYTFVLQTTFTRAEIASHAYRYATVKNPPVFLNIQTGFSKPVISCVDCAGVIRTKLHHWWKKAHTRLRVCECHFLDVQIDTASTVTVTVTFSK